MDSDIRRFVVWTLVMTTCWLIAWPYMGLWHDARLYALEALSRLNPGAFDRDLFLTYGSQGKFTLFPVIFAALIKLLGLDGAAFALTLMGKFLWLGSLLLLTRQLLSWPVGLFGFLLVLAYPGFYDSHKVFAYGESFATPRIYAEAFTLLALGAWLRGRHVAAWLLVLLAGLFHPLMVIPGAALLVWMTAAGLKRTQIVWCVLGLSVVVAFAFMVYPDLKARIFFAYDPVWFEAIALRNPYVFLDRWGGAAFGRMVWVGAVLAIAAREENGILRRFAFAVLLITASLLALSWLGTSVWKNIFLTQLQLWRALWLAQIVSLMLMATLLPRLWKSDYADRILASCLVAALLQDTWTMGLIALVGVAIREASRRTSLSIDTRSFFWRSLPYLIVLPWLLMHFLDMRYWLLVNDFYLSKAGWRVLLADRVVMLAMGIAAYWVLAQAGKGTVKALLGAAGTALLVATLTWSPSGISGSSGLDDVYAQMKQDIPPGSVIASTAQGGVQFIWFKLERSSYVSQDQVVGGLFNRETALEGVRRIRLMEEAGFPNSGSEWGGESPGPEIKKVSIQSIAELCGDTGLDYVVMAGRWERAKQYLQNGRPFLSLYACRDFRVGQGAPL
jgi:hypothetical protein